MAINVFKLEHGMYFVGRTKPECEWTTLHPPIDLYTTFTENESTGITEDTVVEEYMRRFGVESVRGGSYSEVKLSKEQLEGLETILITYGRKSCNHTISYSDCSGTMQPYRRLWRYKGMYDPQHVGYECDMCSIGFDTLEELHAHQDEFECNLPYMCIRCYHGFHTKQECDAHSCEQKFDCDECNYRFDSQEEFDVHECSDDEYHCRSCNIKFRCEENYNEHMKLHAGWICHVCDDVLHTQEEYDSHCKETKPEKCKHCDKHDGHDGWHIPYRYHCRVCGQGFTKYEEEHGEAFSIHEDTCSIQIVNGPTYKNSDYVLRRHKTKLNLTS